MEMSGSASGSESSQLYAWLIHVGRLIQ